MNSKSTARLIGIIAMLVWSAVLLYFYGTGRIGDFIRPEYLRVCSLLAGLGLGVLGVFNLINLKKETECCHDHGEEGHDHDEEHEHEDTSVVGNASMFLVMVVPMLAAAAFSNGGYQSANTIRNKGFVEDPNAVASRVEENLKTSESQTGNSGGDWEYTLADLEKVVDRSDAGNLLLTVDQLFYTTGDEEIQRVLEGQLVETTGQVLPEIGYNPGDKRVRVFTLMVTCCRADAQPVSIPLEFVSKAPRVSAEETADFQEMSWIKVSGVMRYPVENGRTQAVIEVKEMVPTEEPVNEIMF